MKSLARTLQSVMLGTLFLYGAGCASIVHSGNRPVMIDSDPEGASVTIANKDGQIVETGTTPWKVRLDPHGDYFQGAEFKAKFALDGYAPAEARIYPDISPFYVGNLVFGGLVGFLIVDPVTGSMWNLRPLHINQTLQKLPAPPALASTPPPPSPPPAPPAENAPPPPPQAPGSASETSTSPPVVASQNTNAPAQPPVSDP